MPVPYIVETPIQPIDLSPLSPLRNDKIEEVIYLNEWQKLNGGAESYIDYYADPYDDDEWPQNKYPLLDIIPLNKISAPGLQPETRLPRAVSSFMMLLGTASGEELLETAQTTANKLGMEASEESINFSSQNELPAAYALAWALQNVRTTPSSYISRELLMGDWRKDHQMLATGWTVEGVAETFEAFDRAALWLGTKAGQKYLTNCREKIELANNFRFCMRPDYVSPLKVDQPTQR